MIAAPPRAASDVFFRLWTRREALGKLSGLGIARSDSARPEGAAEQSRPYVYSFSPISGTLATLAALPDHEPACA